MARDSRKGISLELRRVSKALIAEANSAKKRIKKVTPASKELGQPLSSVKQFTVKRSCDVVKRFLRWCTIDLLFLPFFPFFLSFLSFASQDASPPSLELRIVRRAQPYYLAASPFPVHCFNYPVARLIAFCASFSLRRIDFTSIFFLSRSFLFLFFFFSERHIYVPIATPYDGLFSLSFNRQNRHR